MPSILRVRTVFTGVAGTPWYSNVYLNDDGGEVQIGLDQMAAFWGGLATLMKSGITWTVEDQAAVINDATGEVVSVASGSGDTGAASSSGNALPYQTQALASLHTGVFNGGRELVGKMYIPGLVEDLNSATGTVDTTFQGDLADSIEEISTTPGNLTQVVYSPTYHLSSMVTGVTVGSKWAVLRSRRD